MAPPPSPRRYGSGRSGGDSLYVARKLVRLVERLAFLRLLSGAVKLDSLLTILALFNAGTFVTAWRTIKESTRTAQVERIAVVMGSPETVGELRKNGEANPRDGPSALTATARCCWALKWAIVLPYVLVGLATRRVPKPLAVLRTAASVASMPFVWWSLARLLRLRRIGTVEGLSLTCAAGSACLLIEDPRRRPMLTWFMLSSALS